MVKAWREKVTIPTYEVGKPEKNPMFLEKRVYQGSSGVVYPYPVIETISDEKEDKDYLAVFLENEYIKVMVLPELGGRVQMAYDKIKQRHFVYYNHVIKPALVGLVGPWISGGIEFNWPQHHRPSTFMPVDTCIEENGDGSVTVWVSEIEKMFHQKGMAGFTLRPGCASWKSRACSIIVQTFRRHSSGGLILPSLSMTSIKVCSHPTSMRSLIMENEPFHRSPSLRVLTTRWIIRLA